MSSLENHPAVGSALNQVKRSDQRPTVRFFKHHKSCTLPRKDIPRGVAKPLQDDLATLPDIQSQGGVPVFVLSEHSGDPVASADNRWVIRSHHGSAGGWFQPRASGAC